MSISCVSSAAGQYPIQSLQSPDSQSPPNASADASASASPVGGHHAHHRHHGGGGGVSDLLDAVSNALDSADSSADPNQVIEDTISKLLAANGATAGSADGADAASGDGTSASSSTSGSQKGTSAATFAETLKAHGIDFQQFRADLLAAVKDAQNGKVNPATALKSLPAGSALDLTA